MGLPTVGRSDSMMVGSVDGGKWGGCSILLYILCSRFRRKLVAVVDSRGTCNPPTECSAGNLFFATSFRLNLLQRIYKRMEHPPHFPPSTLPTIMESLLQMAGRPTLLDHVERLGPMQWRKTAAILKQRNLLFSQIFLAGAELLQIYEEHPDTWLY